MRRIQRSLAHVLTLGIISSTGGAFISRYQPVSANARIWSTREDNNNSDEPSNQEGKELAQEFYKFQKRRESSGNDLGNSLAPQSEKRPIKFTGRREAPPSPSVYSSSSSSLFSPESRDTSPVEREREGEFNLAGTFERTLPIQAGVLALSLAFVLFVGLTGGITDGSERDFGYDEMDVIQEQMLRNNVLIPMDDFNAAVEDAAGSQRSNPSAVAPSATESLWL